jgi:hypothetical protein
MNDDCIIFKGYKSKTGYGQKSRNGILHKAHRLAYWDYYGAFDSRLHVLHRCDNPSCVNPLHLFLGTHQENMLDMKIKGRAGIPDTKGEKNGQSKLSYHAVKMIRQFIYQGIPGIELAKAYRVSTAQISRIKNNRKWKITTEENYV